MKQSKHQVKGLLEGLLWLKDKATNTKDLEHVEWLGICHYLNKYCSGGYSSLEYDFVSELSLGWEHHSGNKAYPIPNCSEVDDWWAGEQLEYRLSLIDYLIAKLELMSNEECIERFGLCK